MIGLPLIFRSDIHNVSRCPARRSPSIDRAQVKRCGGGVQHP
jgi:hypothetical protein